MSASVPRPTVSATAGTVEMCHHPPLSRQRETEVTNFWSASGRLPDRPMVPTENYHATDAVLRAISEAEHVRFISIFDALCNDDGCLTHTSASLSELLAWDDGHLTAEGAAYVVGKLGLDRER
jgi:lysophospholipase L1-like esterase